MLCIYYIHSRHHYPHRTWRDQVISSNYHVSSFNDRVTADPSESQAVDWCLTLQLKKGLKGDDKVSYPAHWLGDLGPPGQGSEPVSICSTQELLHLPCSLPTLDAISMKTLYHAWWSHCHMVLKQQGLFVRQWACELSSKTKILLRSSHPPLGLFSLSCGHKKKPQPFWACKIQLCINTALGK